MRSFLLLMSLVILTLFVKAYFDPKLNPVGLGSDGWEYQHLASNLSQSHHLAYTQTNSYPLFNLDPLVTHNLVPAVIPCTTRAPGYPFLLSVIQSLWSSPWTAIILNYLFFIGICIYGFLLAELFFRDRFRMVFNILLVFSPLYFVRWGVGSEFMAGFFITGFTYHFMKNIQDRSLWHLWMACLLAIGANLTRSNLFIYTVGFAIVALMIGLLRKQRSIQVNAAALFIVSIVSLAPWMYRNYLLTDQWTLSTQGGFVLHRVHLGYDLPQNDPVKEDLFIKHLKAGKTFNQTEAIVDKELKAIVFQHYQNDPGALVKKTSDHIRTLFLFSYFDISDALVMLQKPIQERLKFVNSSSSEYKNDGLLRNSLFQVSRAYKWFILLGFFLLPFLVLFNKTKLNVPLDQIFLLYIPTLLSVLATAVFTGAGGDRMRLPFNAPILICVVFSIMLLWIKTKKT
jgi:hypothetical protein